MTPVVYIVRYQDSKVDCLSGNAKERKERIGSVQEEMIFLNNSNRFDSQTSQNIRKTPLIVHTPRISTQFKLHWRECRRERERVREILLF